MGVPVGKITYTELHSGGVTAAYCVAVLICIALCALSRVFRARSSPGGAKVATTASTATRKAAGNRRGTYIPQARFVWQRTSLPGIPSRLGDAGWRACDRKTIFECARGRSPSNHFYRSLDLLQRSLADATGSGSKVDAIPKLDSCEVPTYLHTHTPIYTHTCTYALTHSCTPKHVWDIDPPPCTPDTAWNYTVARWKQIEILWFTHNLSYIYCRRKCYRMKKMIMKVERADVRTLRLQKYVFVLL